ncbi:MAG TPA: MarR family winged helix-turn-helix transcriptional regulator [Archangium sp.]
MTTLARRIERTERLARAVGRLRRAMLARVAPVLEHEGRPLVHWQLVSAIAYDGLHSQAALAARVGMDPAGTSRALDELEQDGLVKRQRDADDRRRVSVNLTAKGVRWYERVRPEVMGSIAPIFEPLNREEAVQLEALLSRLASHSSASGSISDGSA